MAYPVYNPIVGQLVYKSFSPVQAGKIVAIVRCEDEGDEIDSCSEYEVRVKWIKNGEESIVSTRGLNDFKALIEEHQKKLDTHLRTKEKLELL